MPFQESTEETKPDEAGRLAIKQCKLKSSKLKISILKKKKNNNPQVKTGVWSKFSHDKTENLAKFEARLGNYVMYNAVPGRERR